MSENSVVKVMRVLKGEHIACAYCGVSVKKRGVMARELDERGMLRELLFFCSQGCGLMHVTATSPDDDTEDLTPVMSM